MDLLAMKLAGIWLTITSLVGLCWTILYDYSLHRAFSLGINAWIALAFFSTGLVLGIIVIVIWLSPIKD